MIRYACDAVGWDQTSVVCADCLGIVHDLGQVPTAYVEIKLDLAELKQHGKELIAAADAKLSVKQKAQN